MTDVMIYAFKSLDIYVLLQALLCVLQLAEMPNRLLMKDAMTY